ncbi:hypothetical protein D3C71_712570 [compost metagenome]
MEAQVGLPGGGRHVGQHLVHFAEEARLGQRELLCGRHLQGVEQRGPAEVRGQLVRVGGAERVVALGRVTHLDARHRGLGQAGLERHHRLGLFGSLRGVNAGQRQHLRDIGNVGVADLGLRLVEVIALLRQAEAALADVGDDVGRILVIGIGEQREQHALALRLAVAQVLGDGGGVVQRRDLVQRRLQRRQAGGLDLRFVVAGLPDVADLGFHRAGLGLAGGGLLHQRVLHFQRALAQDLEAAPGGLVARHRVGLQPLAVDEAVEVGACGDGRIQVGAVERDQRGLDLRLVERRLGGVGSGRGLVLATGGERGGDGDGQAQRDQIADIHGESPTANRPA